MNYQIITDEAKLKEFIDWLPELAPEETFYCCLFARSKYCKGIAHVRSDKAQLKRFTASKQNLLEKIRQLECPVGAYTMKEVGTAKRINIPQEALAIYITINPRSFIIANKNSVRKLLDLALQPYNGFHPYQEVMSEVQKAKSKTRCVIFDFDISKDKYQDLRTEIIEQIGHMGLWVLETRGGYHVIVNPAEVGATDKNWYNKMRVLLAKYSIDHDNAGDLMSPIPGTYQGGFTPRFIDL